MLDNVRKRQMGSDHNQPPTAAESRLVDSGPSFCLNMEKWRSDEYGSVEAKFVASLALIRV